MMRAWGKRGLIGVWLVCVVSGWLFAADVRERVERGNQLFKEGKIAEAQQAYAEAQVDAPESAEVAFNLGTTFYRQGRYEEALRTFERALGAEDPLLVAKAHYNIGNTLVQQGKLREALEAYKRCLEITRDDEDAKYNIEYVQRKLKELASKQKEEQEKNPLHKLLKELERLIALQAAHVAETRGLMKRGNAEVTEALVQGLATNEQRYAERARELTEGFRDVRTNLPAEVMGGAGGGQVGDEETRALVEVYRELAGAGRAVEEALGEGREEEARQALTDAEKRLGQIGTTAGGELSRQFADAGRSVVEQLKSGLGDTNELAKAAEAYGSLMENLQRELMERAKNGGGAGGMIVGGRSLGERIDAAIGHMERAVTNLTRAAGLLKSAWTNAMPDQVEGLENLIRARKEFEDEQQQQQQQQQQGGRSGTDKEKREQEQGEQGQDKKEDESKGEKEQEQQAKPEQQQGSQDQQTRREGRREEEEQPRMTPEQVEQLLRAFGEEQRNQQRARRQRLQQGYVPVDKDW